jgi:tRNA nucleotidyltransferase (CCA-adding enzyme)
MAGKRRLPPAPPDAGISQFVLTRLPTRVVRGLRERLAPAASGRGVYLVGGAVRDFILARDHGLEVGPLSEIDVLVDFDLRDAVKALRPVARSAVVNAPFMTAKFTFPGCEVDIARPRSETYPEQGKLPVVTGPASVEDDLRRRDFTVNAMAAPFDIAGGAPTEIIDPYGGRGDLARRVIRVLHTLSFRDDPTRIFRALRYAARLGFEIDGGTRTLIAEAVEKRFCAALTPSRMLTELKRILAEPTCVKAIGGLAAAGVFFGDVWGLNPLYEAAVARIESGLKSAQRLQRRAELPPSVVYEPWFYRLIAVADPTSYGREVAFLKEAQLPHNYLAEMRAFLDHRGEVTGAVKEITRLAGEREKRERVFDLLEPIPASTLLTILVLTDDQRLKRFLEWYEVFLTENETSLSAADLKGIGFTPHELGKAKRAILRAYFTGDIRGKASERAFAESLLTRRG